MTQRPRRTVPDRNQAAEHAKLRGWGCLCIDVHDLPGNETANSLDAFVLSPCGRYWLQVEWKVGPSASFTDNEVAYFKHLGIWDSVETRILEPLAQIRQHGKPIIVAWEAMQIMDVFGSMRVNANRAKQRANAAVDGRRSAQRGT